MIRANHRAGFSIAELLVVAGIFAVIMALTSLLFFSGRDAMEQSTEKVDTAGRARRAMDSLTPLVASTVETGGFEAITVFDPTLEDMTDQCHMDLTTRENFLDTAYTPTAPFDAAVADTTNQMCVQPGSRAVTGCSVCGERPG